MVGGGTFFDEGYLFFVFCGEGSLLLGENKAFIAESSDWLAINDRTSEELKQEMEIWEMRKLKNKKVKDNSSSN